jgi:RNA polymerase sigma-70 factor (ECF subfamily)
VVRRYDCGDAELVACARTGDREAFAELVRRHRDVAYRLAGRLLGSSELGWDAVQEACVAALLSLDRLRTPERFGSWLCGIALNVARGMLREHPPLPLDVQDLRAVDAAPRPDEVAESNDLARRVREAVAGLAAGQRDAVLLFYLQSLTHREVADELGISVGAVKARLHQARAVLADRLAGEREPAMSRTTEPTWVDVTVLDVRRKGEDDPGPCPHVAVLQEVDGERTLAIWMLEREAVSLARSLEGNEMPRPMTYQLAAGLVAASGARVREVRVTRLDGHTFYAEAIVESEGRIASVDARPSDALNLAVVAGAPIRVDGEVFPAAGADNEVWRRYPTGAGELGRVTSGAKHR